MENPLDNPLLDLHGPRGEAPDWIWKVAASGAGIAGGIIGRKLLGGVRTKVSRRGDVPLNPGDERMTWPYALLWAGAVGVAASLGRLFAQRIVAAVWTRREGRPVASMPGA